MGLFDFFKRKKFKIKKIEFIDESHLVNLPKTELKFNGIEIEIECNSEDSLKHINEDYEVLKKEGLEKFIRADFITWLKGDEFIDLDDDEIYKGLKLTEISYCYHFICDKYSPTNKGDNFGQFRFTFVSGNRYTKNLLEAADFVLLINNGKIYYDQSYEV